MTIEEYFGDWLGVLDKQELNKVIARINLLYKTKSVTPEYKDIFKAFTLCSRHDCKVVFLGQDPYPQKEVATGVLFGNKSDTKILSPSLEIIKASVLKTNQDTMPFPYFDVTLESWARQGILLLNSALTCEVGHIGSHTVIWRTFISKFLYELSRTETGMLYVLFGEQAQSFIPYLSKYTSNIIKVKHPAYYARTNEELDPKLFVDINKFLIGMYGTPIYWCTE